MTPHQPPPAGKVPAECRFHHRKQRSPRAPREKCGSAEQMIAIFRRVPSGRRAMPPMKGSAGRARAEWRRPDVGIDGTSLSRKRSRVVALLVPCVHPCRSASPRSMTAAGHDELLATHPSRTAVAAVAHLDTARARLVISRAGHAVSTLSASAREA